MPIRIGTGDHGGTFYSQGLALKTVLERSSALAPVEVRESVFGKSIENANRLHTGDLDFGFMAAPWIGRAAKGEAPFVQPIELRVAAPMNMGPMFFIARADSALRSLSDLRGRQVAVGLKNSGMAQHAHAVFAALGLGAADLTPVYLDFADGAEALAFSTVDAQFQCPIPNRVMTELSERMALRVLSYGPGQLESVLRAIPYDRRTVMRSGAFRGLDADLPQLAVVNVLVTHARAAEAPIYNAVRAILSASAELGRLNPLFAGLAELFEVLRTGGPSTIEFGGVALHPGALRAYQEIGLLA